MNTETVNGVVFGFVRRRYGHKTFTWLHHQNSDGRWQEYVGDPWPSVKIPKRDLERIASELTNTQHNFSDGWGQ